MSTWLFDLGNSRLKYAPLHAGGGVAVERLVEIAHDGVALPDDGLQHLPQRIDVALVASVAPAMLTTALLDMLARCSTRITRVRTQRACAGVRIAYAEPSRLGVDRFLALLAARARGAEAWLVIGVGTAMTIDLLDAAGRHHGGRIAPSPTLMREALCARAAQLPASGGRYVDFADDTIDALASGCEGAALALIAGSRDNAVARLRVTPRILMHGGGSPALLQRVPGAIAQPALVLEGLACWMGSIAR